MAFSPRTSESFGKVFERSPYSVQDPLVKVQWVAKGNNIVFGRNLAHENYENLIYLGKIFETTVGKSYLGADAWMDVTFPHIMYVTGTRGSGKSFDLGVLVEGISTLARPSPVQNGVTPITSIIIDTQSQFWTLRFAPREQIDANRLQLGELQRWNIAPNHLSNSVVFAPPQSTKFLGDERELTIRPKDVTHSEWCSFLGQEVYGPQGHILAATLEAMGDRNFEISDLVAYISNDRHWPNVAEASRNVLVYRLGDYAQTGLFSKQGFSIRDLLVPGQCSILLLRDLRNEDKALITAIIARQLFQVMGAFHTRRKVTKFFGENGQPEEDLPSKVWLVIDEAHVVAPKEGPSPARDALVEYVKRGRDAGLSLVLATQQPSAVDDRILSQVNLTLNHRLTFQSDIAAAMSRIPTKMVGALKVNGSSLSDFGDMMRILESGQCFIGDHSTSRTMMLQVRPRISAHGGYSPL